MAFKKRQMFVSCYDMFMTLAPATLLSVGCMLLNLIFLVLGAHNFTLFKKVFPVAMESIGFACVSFYLLMFSIGLLTVITEWKKILASPKKKIISLFTFPLFMLTYIPISLVALFKRVELQQQYKQ